MRCRTSGEPWICYSLYDFKLAVVVMAHFTQLSCQKLRNVPTCVHDDSRLGWRHCQLEIVQTTCTVCNIFIFIIIFSFFFSFFFFFSGWMFKKVNSIFHTFWIVYIWMCSKPWIIEFCSMTGALLPIHEVMMNYAQNRVVPTSCTFF